MVDIISNREATLALHWLAQASCQLPYLHARVKHGQGCDARASAVAPAIPVQGVVDGSSDVLRADLHRVVKAVVGQHLLAPVLRQPIPERCDGADRSALVAHEVVRKVGGGWGLAESPCMRPPPAVGRAGRAVRVPKALRQQPQVPHRAQPRH